MKIKLKTSILLEGNNEVQREGTVHEVTDDQGNGLIVQGYAEEFVEDAPAEDAPAKGKGK